MTVDDNPSLYEPSFFIAWETFADELKHAFRAASRDDKTGPVALKQARYVLANMALAKLLKSVGQKETAEHFFVIAEALHDLSEGIPHPLLKIEMPAKRGRQPDTSAVWRLRSNICVALNFMIAGGMTDVEAINFAAKNYKNSFKKLLRPGAGINSSLETWIQKFNADEISNEIALCVFKYGVASLNELKAKFSGEQLQNAGKSYLAKLAERSETL